MWARSLHALFDVLAVKDRRPAWLAANWATFFTTRRLHKRSLISRCRTKTAGGAANVEMLLRRKSDNHAMFGQSLNGSAGWSVTKSQSSLLSRNSKRREYAARHVLKIGNRTDGTTIGTVRVGSTCTVRKQFPRYSTLLRTDQCGMAAGCRSLVHVFRTVPN